MCSILLRGLLSKLSIIVPYCDCIIISGTNINHLIISNIPQQEESFHHQIGLKFKEETS
jgi:hypothetical protein